MVFRVNKGGDQSSPTDGERGYRRILWGEGGGKGGDHKNFKILKKPQGGSGEF